MLRFRIAVPATSKTICRPRLGCISARVLVSINTYGSVARRSYSTGPIPTASEKEKLRMTEGNDMKEFVDPRIHILGTGALGKLVAYSFSDIANPPPLTLMFSNKTRWSEFMNNGSTLEYVRNGVSDLHRGYDAQYTNIPRPDLDTREIIDHLVVATKATFTTNALRAVKYRLRPQSTIAFLQNGMGLMEEINERVFPDAATRPHYILGSVTHGAIGRDSFTVDHAAIGNIALTTIPKTPHESESELEFPSHLLAPTTRHLLRTFTRTPLLGGIPLSPRDHLLVRLEKLASNCVINPLTAILGCRNGELLNRDALKLMRLLLAEISLVIRSMPELQNIPGIENRYSPATLEHIVTKLIESTAANQSSMLQDVMQGRKTEIDYLNGWIFRRGEELGIRSMVNFTMKTLVVARSRMSHAEYKHLVAFDDNAADLDSGPAELL